jgi:hypothetical protein
MSPQKRYERYRQMVAQIILQQPSSVPSEQLVALAAILNEPPFSSNQHSFITYLISPYLWLTIKLLRKQRYVVATTNQRVLLIGLSKSSNKKIDSTEILPFSAVQILDVRPKGRHSGSIAQVSTPTASYWFHYYPTILDLNLDPILSYIQQQTRALVPPTIPPVTGTGTVSTIESVVTNENHY